MKTKRIYIDGKRVKKVRHKNAWVWLVAIGRRMVKILVGKGRKRELVKVPLSFCTYGEYTLQELRNAGKIDRRPPKHAYA